MSEHTDLPPPDEREVVSLSPEARRRRREQGLRRLLRRPILRRDLPRWKAVLAVVLGPFLPGTRAFEVAKRTAVGTYHDGFIHAGNLAYLSMLAIFPFFIVSGALFQLFGEAAERQMVIDAILLSMPPTVARVIEPVASDVIGARSGLLLWLGVGVGLWTISSLIETVRDILRRAYGTHATKAFWQYRLASTGIILGAVILLLMSLFATVVISTAQQVIDARFPQLNDAVATLRLSRIVPALGLTASLYMLFYTLTPGKYRKRCYPKWPGAVFTAAWWVTVTTALPPILRSFFSLNLTYGSLAGIVIALFFFWLVGLGLVIGAELNAALAEPEANGKKVEEETT
jgi:membrane protein